MRLAREALCQCPFSDMHGLSPPPPLTCYPPGAQAALHAYVLATGAHAPPGAAAAAAAGLAAGLQHAVPAWQHQQHQPQQPGAGGDVGFAAAGAQALMAKLDQLVTALQVVCRFGAIMLPPVQCVMHS